MLKIERIATEELEKKAQMQTLIVSTFFYVNVIDLVHQRFNRIISIQTMGIIDVRKNGAKASFIRKTGKIGSLELWEATMDYLESKIEKHTELLPMLQLTDSNKKDALSHLSCNPIFFQLQLSF